MVEDQDSLDGVTVVHTDQPEADHVAEATRILNDNNQRHGYQWSSLPLSVVLKDAQGKIVGGLIGSTNWGWLHVDLLSVNESLRGSGYGTKLLDAAENIARQRGCSFAYLDTFSFQAQGFYEKHGYKVWGNLEEFPPGASRIFLKKSLLDE